MGEKAYMYALSGSAEIRHGGSIVVLWLGGGGEVAGAVKRVAAAGGVAEVAVGRAGRA